MSFLFDFRIGCLVVDASIAIPTHGSSATLPSKYLEVLVSLLLLRFSANAM